MAIEVRTFVSFAARDYKCFIQSLGLYKAEYAALIDIQEFMPVVSVGYFSTLYIVTLVVPGAKNKFVTCYCTIPRYRLLGYRSDAIASLVSHGEKVPENIAEKCATFTSEEREILFTLITHAREQLRNM